MEEFHTIKLTFLSQKVLHSQYVQQTNGVFRQPGDNIGKLEKQETDAELSCQGSKSWVNFKHCLLCNKVSAQGCSTNLQQILQRPNSMLGSKVFPRRSGYASQSTSWCGILSIQQLATYILLKQLTRKDVLEAVLLLVNR